MAEIEMLSVVALLEDVPGKGLLQGQIGTVVEDLAQGVYEVEFSDDDGRLLKQAGHPTAAEIFEPVNCFDPRSIRATIYNNLRDLVQADWCVKWPWRAARRDLTRKVCGITT